MNIIIPSVQVPFISGGATLMTNSLKDNLIKYGHNVEVVTIPFKFFPTDYLEKNIDYWLEQDFSDFNGKRVDKVIVLQFPSYYVKHPDKTLWLMHQHRAVYDLYNTFEYNIELEKLKEKITKLDTTKLKEIQKRYSISKNVSDRLEKFNGVISYPLYHPPYEEEKFFTKESDNYIFFPSRLEYLKRQSLVIEAMAYLNSPIKLILAGAGSHYYEYKQLIESLNLSHKVTLLGHISQKEKFKLYASSLAVIFPPYDEDYGYITLEAMLSSKPIITCIDSGAVLEFVENNQNGFVVEPNPKEIAQKIDYLYYNKQKAKNMGQLSKEIYNRKNISWENVVSKLVGDI